VTKQRLEDRLVEGAKRRAALIARFGFVPESILRISRGKLHKTMFHFASERNRRGLQYSVMKRANEDSAKRQAGRIVDAPYKAGKDRTTVSMMAAELVAFTLEYYLPEGGVYLDPFSGQGVQAQVAALANVDYYGMDISQEYVDYTNAVLGRYKTSTAAIVVTRGDSRHPDWIDDGYGDFCFTSPPYWDIEFYSDDEEQLGLDSTYEEFLEGMADVFAAWHPKFKQGATVVVNVNDFRRDGAFSPYHADTIRLMQDIGYELHDLWVIDGLVGGISRAFAVERNLTAIAPKVHEYLLVFKVT